MEVVSSFTIDHTNLLPGIYISREDKGFTTFDLRITAPNKEPWVDPTAMHTLEHWFATWFRNSIAKENVVYVGPMGCMTGMYVIMTGSPSVEYVRQLTIDCLNWCMQQTEVPATTPATCGNYLYHNLDLAQYWCFMYLYRLQNEFHSEYTKLNVSLSNGMQFADA